MELNLNLTISTFFFLVKIESPFHCTLTVIGWIGNALIIAVTLRSKNLRSPCNKLIAVQAVSDIIMQTAHPLLLYYSYTETVITLYRCFLTNFFAVTAIDFSSLLMLFIAFDRLASTKYPLFYQKVTGRRYVFGIVLICLTYSMAMRMLTYTSLTEELTFCVISENATGLMANVWIASGTLVNMAVVVTYIALTRATKAAHPEYHRINRSLNVIISVYIFCWLIPFCLCFVALMFYPGRLMYIIIEVTVGIFPNVSLASPFFIYYFRSALYRSEIQKMFRPKGAAITVQSISQ